MIYLHLHNSTPNSLLSCWLLRQCIDLCIVHRLEVHKILNYQVKGDSEISNARIIHKFSILQINNNYSKDIAIFNLEKYFIVKKFPLFWKRAQSIWISFMYIQLVIFSCLVIIDNQESHESGIIKVKLISKPQIQGLLQYYIYFFYFFAYNSQSWSTQFIKL